MASIRHFLILCGLVLSVAFGSDEDSESSQADHFGNFPRFFGVFSRPKPEAEKETKVGLKQHLGNVLQGGTIGFQAEFNPLGKIHGVIDHAKKFIPFPDITPVKSSGVGDKDIQPDKGKDHHENIESEDIFGWEPQDPNVGDSKDPKIGEPEGPKWEDIGEEEGYEEEPLPEDYEEVPIEKIIQPRRRPKRFLESKVYHVPLEFLSNAKPVEVKVQNHV